MNQQDSTQQIELTDELLEAVNEILALDSIDDQPLDSINDTTVSVASVDTVQAQLPQQIVAPKPAPVSKYDISKFADSIPLKYNKTDNYEHNFYPKLSQLAPNEYDKNFKFDFYKNYTSDVRIKKNVEKKVKNQISQIEKLKDETSIVTSESKSIEIFKNEVSKKQINKELYKVDYFPKKEYSSLMPVIEPNVSIESQEKDSINIKETIQTEISTTQKEKNFTKTNTFDSNIDLFSKGKDFQIAKNTKPYKYDWTGKTQSDISTIKSYTILNKGDDKQELEPKGENAWMLWYIIAGLFVFVWMRMFYKRYIDATIKAGFNRHIANKLYSENNQISIRSSLILSILFFSIAGLFLFQVLQHYNVIASGVNGINLTLKLSGIFALIYIIKYIALYFIGFIFKATKYVSEYLFTVFLYNKILGLTLFPLVISIPYLKSEYVSPQHLIYIGFGVCVFFYLKRIIRGFVISLRSKVSIFYLILYLCILEFGPLLIIYKIITSYCQISIIE
jgi:hypothetical protein